MVSTFVKSLPLISTAFCLAGDCLPEPTPINASLQKQMITSFGHAFKKLSAEEPIITSAKMYGSTAVLTMTFDSVKDTEFETRTTLWGDTIFYTRHQADSLDDTTYYNRYGYSFFNKPWGEGGGPLPAGQNKQRQVPQDLIPNKKTAPDALHAGIEPPALNAQEEFSATPAPPAIQ